EDPLDSDSSYSPPPSANASEDSFPTMTLDRKTPSFNHNTPTFSGVEQTDLRLLIRIVENQFYNKDWPEEKKVSSFIGQLSGAAVSWAFDLTEQDPSTQSWDRCG
ncbi:hypothetical protein BGW38_010527, partial [Lunasporangiospora selenospora]